MKYRLLPLAALGYGLALLAARHFAPSLVTPGLYAVYAISFLLAFRTAFAYASSDRLRWAWFVFGAGYLIAFVGKLSIGDSAGWRSFTPTQAIAWAVTIFVLNATGTAATARCRSRPARTR
jgi:hypothetical protein